MPLLLLLLYVFELYSFVSGLNIMLIASYEYDRLQRASNLDLPIVCPVVKRILASTIVALLIEVLLLYRLICWKYVISRPYLFKWLGPVSFLLQITLTGLLIILIDFRTSYDKCWTGDSYCYKVYFLEYRLAVLY